MYFIVLLPIISKLEFAMHKYILNNKDDTYELIWKRLEDEPRI